jgi:GNAT superfamily N-acetyltransferase
MSSFWSSLTVPWARERFTPLLRTVETEPLVVRRATEADGKRLTEFLEQFFGHTVALKPLLDPAKEIILFHEQEGQIVATIRYKQPGLFESKPIHLIDCFCTHPSWRRTGVASKLLGALHAYTNRRHLLYSLFLKEGAPLPKAMPLYSSSYAFRRTYTNSEDLKPLSSQKASALINQYRRFYPDTVWIHNLACSNQLWRFWKKGLNWMLACVQDAFQELEGGRIGWMTAFFASGTYNINDIVANLPYKWIWIDAKWLGSGADQWTLDTTFHWYAYQWTTCLQIENFYGIVL